MHIREKMLIKSGALDIRDERFVTALRFIAMKEDKVIGRVDASLISSRSDAFCFSACMDWICAQKYEETAIIVK